MAGAKHPDAGKYDGVADHPNAEDYGTMGNRPVKAGGKFDVAGAQDYMAQNVSSPSRAQNVMHKVKEALSAQERVGKIMAKAKKSK